jgi:hypothetical protein
LVYCNIKKIVIYFLTGFRKVVRKYHFYVKKLVRAFRLRSIGQFLGVVGDGDARVLDTLLSAGRSAAGRQALLSAGKLFTRAS